MEQEFLFNPDGPALAILPATPSAVRDLMGVSSGRRRACEVNRTPRFMNEVAASLQPPLRRATPPAQPENTGNSIPYEACSSTVASL